MDLDLLVTYEGLCFLTRIHQNLILVSMLAIPEDYVPILLFYAMI